MPLPWPSRPGLGSEHVAEEHASSLPFRGLVSTVDVGAPVWIGSAIRRGTTSGEVLRAVGVTAAVSGTTSTMKYSVTERRHNADGVGQSPMWEVRQMGPAGSPLIVHVPHAGVQIPVDERAGLLLDDIGLAAEIDRMTDWHTDRLATAAVAASGVGAVVFANRFSRLVVDPERFTDDTEPMAAVGMGAVYRVTSDLRPLRHADPGEDQRILDRWFHPYAAALTAVVDETLAEHGSAVILDLHSYPSSALAYELDQDAPRPGVCIGTDPTHTPVDLASAAAEAFSEVTGGLAENSPFAGTYVPLRHWQRATEVTSIMIEIRRDLYQSEPGGAIHRGFNDIAGRLAHFLKAVARRSDH